MGGSRKAGGVFRGTPVLKNGIGSKILAMEFVTGRAGRTSYAEKPICEHHAQKYLIETAV